MPGPKPLSLELSDHERRVLRGWLRKQAVPQVLVLRSRIVLACAEGRSNTRVADDLGVSRETVRKWRSRFAADWLEGLVGPPALGGATEDHGRAGRSPGRQDSWPDASGGRFAVVDAFDGRGAGHVAVGRVEDLAGVRP